MKKRIMSLLMALVLCLSLLPTMALAGKTGVEIQATPGGGLISTGEGEPKSRASSNWHESGDNSDGAITCSISTGNSGCSILTLSYENMDTHENVTEVYTAIPQKGFTFDGWTYTYWADDTNEETVTLNDGDKIEQQRVLRLDGPITANFVHKHDDGTVFQAWNKDNRLPDEQGNYVLTTDVTLSETWTVPTGTTNLCLNGHVIKRPSDATSKYPVITVSDGTSEAVLNLYDCNGDGMTHYFTYNSEAAWALRDDTPNTAVTLDQFDKTTAVSGETVVAVTGGCITGGVAKSGAATTGGGVYITSKGTFNLYGGSIIGNDASGGSGADWRGGGVRNGGTFDMHGGNIVGNYAYVGGGVGINANKEVTMYGGTIAYNEAKSGGGGGVSGDSTPSSITTFTMKSGTISGNAGGVSEGNFIMKGGTITDNKATGGSGTGGVSGVDFTMYGGEISNNTGTSYGGVRSSGNFVMEKGSITGNIATSATVNGSGVSAKNFTMYGGEIRNNDATTSYADESTYGTIYGVGVSASGVAILGGTARITGNTAGEEGTKFAKDFLGSITFGTGTDTEAGGNGVPVPENGMFVGIRGKDGAFTDGNEAYAAYAKYFFADKDTQYVSYDAESHKIGLSTIPAGNYLINVAPATKGSVTATVNSVAAPYAEKNAEVTLTATPDAGCNFVSLTVKDADNADIELSGEGNTRTFTMPDKAVTVTATFEKPAISYVSRSWNETDKTVEQKSLQNDEYTVVTDSLTEFTSGWYVVKENVTINGNVSILNDAKVNLILCDDKTLTVNGMVGDTSSGSQAQACALTIYGQEKGNGGLTVTQSGTAYEQAIEVYELTVHGGTLNLTGNTASTTSACSGVSAHNMTVYAGKINATGNNTKGQSFGMRIENYGDLKIYGGDVAVNSVGNTWNPYQYTWGVYDGKVYLYGGSLKVDAKSTYVTTEGNPERVPYAIGSPFNGLRIYGGQFTTSGVTKALNIKKLQWGDYGIKFNDTEVKVGMESLPEGFTVLTSANQDGTGAVEWDKLQELRDGDYKYVQITVDTTPKFEHCNGTDVIKSETKPNADPTWGNYTFAGWFTKRVGGDELTGDPQTGKTYYAHWTKNSKNVLTEKLTVKSDGLYIGETKLTAQEAALYGLVFTEKTTTPTETPAKLTITDVTIESPSGMGFENTVDDLVIEVKGTNYITANGFDFVDIGYGNEQWQNYAMYTGAHAMKFIGDGELTAEGGDALDQNITTEAAYPRFISYGFYGKYTSLITIAMEKSGKLNAIGGNISSNISGTSSGYGESLQLDGGTLTAKGGNVTTTAAGRDVSSSGFYSYYTPTMNGGKLIASAGAVAAVTDGKTENVAVSLDMGFTAEVLKSLTITGVKETPAAGYARWHQSGTDPVVISFGPSITVSKAKVSEQDVANPVYGTAQSTKAFFNVVTENFDGTPTFKLEWKSGDTWVDTAPEGITATFTNGVISIGTTATLNAGDYEFRITNGKSEKIEDSTNPGTMIDNPDFVSCEAKLTVDKCATLPEGTPTAKTVKGLINKDGQTGTIDAALLGVTLDGAAVTIGTETDNNNIVNITGTTYTFAETSTQTTATVALTVSSTNYADFSFTLTFETVDKTEVTFPETFAFGGGNLVYGTTYTETAPTLKDGDKTVTPTVTYSYEEKTGESAWQAIGSKPADVGTYRVTIAVVDTDENYMGSKTYEFTIAKAEQTAPAVNTGFSIDYEKETLTASDNTYEVSSTNGDTVTALENNVVTPGGTYYVRLKGDDNHKPSPWTEISVPARPSAVSGVTAHQESIKNKDDASLSGVSSAMEYCISVDNAEYGAWLQGDGATIDFRFGTNSPASRYDVKVRYKATISSFAGAVTTYTFEPTEAKLTVTFSGTGTTQQVAWNGTLTKPETDPAREGYTFGGWYMDEACTQAWNFATDTVTEPMTLYPKWIEIQTPNTVVKGTVTEGTDSVSGATVELYLGTTKVAATTTDEDGKYTFDYVENGLYNIVVTKNPNDFEADQKKMTAMVTVNTGEETTYVQDVELPTSNISSEVRHNGSTVDGAKSDIKKTVVGGLDKVAEKNASLDAKVTVKLTVEPMEETSVEHASELKTEAGSGKKVEFLDLTLTRQVGDGAEEPIGDSNQQLLTIVIPFDFTGVNVSSVMILRHHGSSEKLTKNPADGSEGFTVDAQTGTITICAKQFSEYAIAYEEQSSGGGGGSSYAVTASSTKNGTVTLNKKNAPAGSTVTITVAPDKGYTLETLTVFDKNGKEIEVKDLGNGKYSFKMPSGKVTVNATFMEDNSVLNFFVDVKATDYFYDAVLWAAENGITKGTDAVHFSPKVPVTRAQVVTFLWRAAGKSAADYAMSFADVPSGAYYSEAVRWAVAEGITKGTSDITFSPDAVCTRGQIVTFLARFAGVEDTDTASAFSDVKSTDYFAAAVEWAKDNNVTNGVTETTFEPYTNCNRAQVVTFLYRYIGK